MQVAIAVSAAAREVLGARKAFRQQVLRAAAREVLDALLGPGVKGRLKGLVQTNSAKEVFGSCSFGARSTVPSSELIRN
jgi:hypothetical protein